MTSEEMFAAMRDAGALLEGHFLLSSGLHSPRYMQCALLLQHPQLAERFGAQLGEACADLAPQAVASPALGGILVGHEVARALGVRAIFTERKDGGMQLRRGFRVGPGERVLVVEDVITTGTSTRETAVVLEEAGARVVGVAALVNRSGRSGDSGRDNPFDVPFRFLMTADFPTYDAAACPLCVGGSAPIKPGSRS